MQISEILIKMRGSTIINQCLWNRKKICLSNENNFLLYKSTIW